MAGARRVGALQGPPQGAQDAPVGLLELAQRASIAPGRQARGPGWPRFETPLQWGRPRGGSRDAGPTVVAPRTTV